jgi:hypothetical protein
MIGTWLAGFVVYEWVSPTQSLGWWTDFWMRHHPASLAFGASVPAFAVSFALALAVCLLGRRAGAPATANAG